MGWLIDWLVDWLAGMSSFPKRSKSSTLILLLEHFFLFCPVRLFNRVTFQFISKLLLNYAFIDLVVLSSPYLHISVAPFLGLF